MAQFAIYRSQYPGLFDDTRWFVRWLTYADGYSITESALGKATTEGYQPDCLLDYLLAWMLEGRGAATCATYSDWLLTIISISNQLQRGIFHEKDDEDDPRGDRATVTEIEQLSRVRIDLSLPLLDDELGLNHPALDPRVFARARAEMRAEQT